MATAAPPQAERTRARLPARLLGWVRWELTRRIDMTLGVRLIILDRCVKCALLVLGGVAVIVATRSGAIARVALTVQRQLNLSSGNRLWLRLVNDVLQHFGGLSHVAQYALGIAAICYGLLEAFEALGLFLRRRWAEYLVLLATLAFIPLEVAELLHRPSVIKALALLLNLVIAAYLVYRKRLFLERRGPAEAADPA